ncbi:amino acid ABC transporter permease [Desulfobotulus mexicanus]|uniref:Glutamate/aspartate import permease protein GltK n=1 Tax=Desulfobotulus mexicanus TaxID=2586642 RepID=A0A5S5MD21_9BACT|nr:amino acid ABC transporter permease [Desulfobotulus mexicanus]TYT73618.1 ABC transporter permease subunit [Desulfobotulus mexicanus]
MVRIEKWIFLVLCLLSAPGLVVADTASVFRKADNVMATGDLQGAAALLIGIPSPDQGGDVAPFVRSRMQMARIFHAMGDYDAAMAACREVLDPYPQNVEAANFLRSLERETLPAYILFFKDAWMFLPALLKGAVMTLTLVLVTMVVSPIGGLLIALGRISRIPPLSGLCWFIIWFFRGTPLLLQLFFIYYGLPSLGITLKPLTAALLGLGINYSAYLAEIIRGGIESIDDGQMEAAKAIGMTYGQAMRRVIVPQTYKRLIPPMGNEFIALIKDTALVSTIAMVELMRAADQMFNAYFNINVLILAACIYLLFTTVFTFCFETLERRVGVYEKR